MIKLAIPEIGQEELDEIKKVFDSKYLVQGDKVEEFENLLREYLNVKHVIAVSSGTAALHLSLLVLGIKNGDEVIVPDFTFPATSNVVEITGAVTKFVDIKLDSFCIDTEKIENAITDRTKAIIPVQEFGQSCDMNKIIELSKKYNLKIIEDAACALGSEYNGKKVGTIGDIGCFSFHPRKAITTGEGGIIVTNNDDLAEKVKILRNHGLNCLSGKPMFTAAGLNYRMTNIQGAIGVAQMRKLEKINSIRNEIALEYNNILKNIKKITIPHQKSYGKHVWQTYHILFDQDIDRDVVIRMLKDKCIETNYGAYAVHVQPYYREKYKYCDNEYINSLYAYKYGLALPLHMEITKKEINFIADELERILNG